MCFNVMMFEGKWIVSIGFIASACEGGEVRRKWVRRSKEVRLV